MASPLDVSVERDHTNTEEKKVYGCGQDPIRP